MSKDYPILAYIRSVNKQGGNTYSYRTQFNFNFNCNKFHYLKMRLINIIYPLTISMVVQVKHFIMQNLE